jgi:hypothetical protein
MGGVDATVDGHPVSLLIPLEHFDCPHRETNWRHVLHHYTTHHPTWQITTGHSGQPWSKGTAVDRAFRQASGDVLVIADADCIVPPDALNEAVRMVAVGKVQWVVPHRLVRRLTEPQSTQYRDTGHVPRGSLDRPLYAGIAGGGIVVLTRTAYLDIDGIDPRFEGWGGEDVAFGWTLMHFAGHHERLRTDLIHLWHPHQSTHRKPESSDLWARYKAARDDPGALRDLIEERRRHAHPRSPAARSDDRQSDGQRCA